MNTQPALFQSVISIQMNAVLIEVQCTLGNDAQQWSGIRSIALEIGYPGLKGQTLWKNIGWLRERTAPATSTSAHSMWDRAMPEHILVFDFHPFMLPGHAEPEKSYCIRRIITHEDGRRKVSRPITVREGKYSDAFFSCTPTYPEP